MNKNIKEKYISYSCIFLYLLVNRSSQLGVLTTAEDYATVNASYCFSSGIPSSRVIPEGLVQRYRRKDQPITLTECYYNKETSGGDTSWLVDGTGLSTDDMKKQESYVRWDFENTWYMGEDGYPELNFEKILVKQ